MEIKINVTGQKMKVATNLKTYVSGSQEFVKFTFNFTDNSWDMFNQKQRQLSVHFKQGNTVISANLDSNNSVYLPSDISVGECYLTLYGANNNIIGITEGLELKIKENYISTSPESTKMTSSFYEKLVEEYEFETLRTNAKTIVGAINELYNKIK